MWVTVVSITTLAVFVLFWSIVRRVKFFADEDLSARLLAFPVRFQYEVNLITAELKTLLAVRRVEEHPQQEERKWRSTKCNRKWRILNL